jgi:hypothetical protein
MKSPDVLFCKTGTLLLQNCCFSDFSVADLEAAKSEKRS